MLSHTETRGFADLVADYWRNMGLGAAAFALAMTGLGVLTLSYGDFALQWQPVPPWLPGRLEIAYLSGAMLLLAGVAAMLEALMMSSFVVLVHIPSLISIPAPDWAPTIRIQLTALLWASALAASAWIVARSLREQP
jgi:hypothetical protein